MASTGDKVGDKRLAAEKAIGIFLLEGEQAEVGAVLGDGTRAKTAQLRLFLAKLACDILQLQHDMCRDGTRIVVRALSLEDALAAAQRGDQLFEMDDLFVVDVRHADLPAVAIAAATGQGDGTLKSVGIRNDRSAPAFELDVAPFWHSLAVTTKDDRMNAQHN
jgi:hypothetical protein